MAISLTLSSKVRFKVKGSINDEAGIAQPFDFSLTCIRHDADQVQAKLESDGSIVDFLTDVVEDWSGVRDADKAVVPYSADALRALCKIPGVARLTFNAYLVEVGAKEKN